MIMLSLYQDGRAEIASPSRIFQGTDTEQIIVLSPYPATVPLQIAITKPNGTSTGYMPMQNVDIPSEYVGLSAWSYAPKDTLTGQYGTAYINLLARLPATDTNGRNLTTFMCELTIEESTLPSLPEEPTSDVYDLILDYLATYGERLNTLSNSLDELDVSFKDYKSVVRLKDFTVDPITGQGVKYYDNGTTATVQFPIGEISSDMSAAVTVITFTKSSFNETNELAIASTATGFDNARFISQVEYANGDGFDTTPTSIFKGSDGSILLKANAPFDGRIVLNGAGYVTKGEPGKDGKEGPIGVQGNGYYRYNGVLTTSDTNCLRDNISPMHKDLLVGDTIVDNNGLVFSVSRATGANAKNVQIDYRTSLIDLEALDKIEALIPSTASSTNQLADKAFVNSSINNMAAFYIRRILTMACNDYFFKSFTNLEKRYNKLDKKTATIMRRFWALGGRIFSQRKHSTIRRYSRCVFLYFKAVMVQVAGSPHPFHL